MDYSDQRNIFNPQTWAWPVHLIGAGGVNNLVGPILAKMGIQEIHIWDNDILEERNCPTEVAYSYRMTGLYKVDAMTDAIRYLMVSDKWVALGLHMDPPVSKSRTSHRFDVGNQLKIYTHYERVHADTELEGVVISGVDSMSSRQEIWRAVQSNSLAIPLYIDGRSAGEDAAIFALSPNDFDAAEIYEDDWLYSDAEASPLPCGARNVGYISAYLAAEICRIITQFHRQQPIRLYHPIEF